MTSALRVSFTTLAELRYSIGGLGVTISAARSDASAQLEARMRAFPRPASSADIVGEILVAEDPDTAIPRPVGTARTLFEPAYRLEYFADSDTLHLADANVAGSCEPSRRHFRIAVAAGDQRAAFIASHLFFNLALLELLKRCGRYPVHAAAVEQAGQAVLIAGTSGAGKSTLALACALAGFGFLGDDVCLLREDMPTPVVDAFPDEVDVREDMLGHFPSLRAQLGPVRASGKRSVHPLDLTGARVAWSAAPRVLVFPTSARSRPARITAISPDDALGRLVPNVMRTEQSAAQRHLDALARLSRSTRAFELAIADPNEAPAIFSRLLRDE